MTGFIRKHRTFFLSFLIVAFILFCLYAIGPGSIAYTKQDGHPFWLNVFFVNFTFFGDAWFAIGLSGYLLYKGKKEWAAIFISFLMTMLLVQITKNIVAGTSFRVFVEPGQLLYFTREDMLCSRQTFPSGHTAMAFSLAMLWLSRIHKISMSYILLFAAFLLAFSRMYLAQDSFFDVAAGACIGIFSGLFSMYLKARFSNGIFRKPLFSRRAAVRTDVIYQA